MFAVALCLSAVAAFYSIVGLTAIFAAATMPIIIMGSILEVAKLVVTVWLHEYWSRCKFVMKLYLVPAVGVLMLITSMGIFGFLSKAHLDQAVPTGDVAAQVALIDEKINNEHDTITNARSLIAQLDKAVLDISNSPDREVNGRTISSAERSLQVRRSQSRDRAALTKTIEEAQARIVKLQEEKAPIAKELRKVEAEVGPIKYIAALIYGDNPDVNLLERAVRWVIIVLVFVFDPLAVMMLLAATESWTWRRQVIPPPPEPMEKHDAPLDDTPDDASLVEPSRGHDDRPLEPSLAPQQPLADTRDTEDLDIPKLVPVENLDDTLPVEQPQEQTPDDEDLDEHHVIKQAQKLWKQDHPGQTLKEQRQRFDRGSIDQLPWMSYVDDERIVREVTFGKEAPPTPIKGDMFVNTNHQPTRLYKYNGSDWIEVDKNQSDSYTYNSAYIDYLIDGIGTGRYDPDLLTDSEKAQIELRLRQGI